MRVWIVISWPGERRNTELFRNAFEHGKKFHGMKEIPKDLQEKMRKLIREEKAA